MMSSSHVETPSRRLWPRVAPRRAGAAGLALHLGAVPALLAVAAAMAQHSPLDVNLSNLFFDRGSQVFVGHASVLLEVLGHQAARGLPVFAAGIACAASVFSVASGGRDPQRAATLLLAAAMLLTPLMIALLKNHTAAHCPDVTDVFGGIVAYAGERDGPMWAAASSAGHCLPSGHAGGGFALVSFYFFGWAIDSPRWRWAGLAAGVAAGVLFSVVRIAQGAHFTSQVLWSAAVAWTVPALLFAPLLCRLPRSRAGSPS